MSAGAPMTRVAFSLGLHAGTNSISRRWQTVAPGQSGETMQNAGVERLGREFVRRLRRRQMDGDGRDVRSENPAGAASASGWRRSAAPRGSRSCRRTMRRPCARRSRVRRAASLRGDVELAGFRQYDALADALEQRDAEMAFQLANLPADRGLRQIEFPCRARETSVPSGSDKRYQPADRRNADPLQRPNAPKRDRLPGSRRLCSLCVYCASLASPRESGLGVVLVRKHLESMSFWLESTKNGTVLVMFEIDACESRSSRRTCWRRRRRRIVECRAART